MGKVQVCAGVQAVGLDNVVVDSHPAARESRCPPPGSSHTPGARLVPETEFTPWASKTSLQGFKTACLAAILTVLYSSPVRTVLYKSPAGTFFLISRPPHRDRRDCGHGEGFHPGTHNLEAAAEPHPVVIGAVPLVLRRHVPLAAAARGEELHQQDDMPVAGCLRCVTGVGVGCVHGWQ